MTKRPIAITIDPTGANSFPIFVRSPGQPCIIDSITSIAPRGNKLKLTCVDKITVYAQVDLIARSGKQTTTIRANTPTLLKTAEGTTAVTIEEA